MSFLRAWVPSGLCGASCSNNADYDQSNGLYSRVGRHSNAVRLDTDHAGKAVVILKEGERVCGTGAVLASAPLEQSKTYWMVHIQQTGSWSVGVATRDLDLTRSPSGQAQFWGLHDDGRLMAGAETVVARLEKPAEEGDKLGLTYDHVELRLFINGEPVGAPIVVGSRGGRQLFPCVHVDDSAILDVHFRAFAHPPPAGFSELLVEQTLL